jgi:F plasmid transfer operon, TraF, protein
MRRFPVFLAMCFALLALWPATALGQVKFEILGARALGMGGAFVAVADDASAFHWNPAGTMKDSSFSMTFGWDDLHFGDPNLPPTPGAAGGSNLLTAVSGSPLGVSYGYLKLGQVVSVQPDGTVVAQALTVHHLGATYSQTLLPGLVVGATAKYLKGQPVRGLSAAGTADGVVNDALGWGGTSDSKFDFDVGVLGEIGPVRLGVTFKNLLQPTFVGDAGIAIQLTRLVRAGIAVLPTAGLTLAFDIDLDTADPLVGLRRMMALGGEFSLGSRMAVRGGVRWSRDGEWRPIATGGASLRIYKGSWLDGYATWSRSDDRGFGIALRAGS